MIIWLREHKILLLGFLLITTMVAIQIKWVHSAISLQKGETELTLKNAIPSIAKQVNGINHNSFHNTIDSISHIPIEQIKEVIDLELQNLNIDKKVNFAIYQAKEDGIMHGNVQDKNTALLSTIKSCLSCIISFQMVDTIPDIGINDIDIKEFNVKHSYFSPVNTLKDMTHKDIVWLALVPDENISQTILSNILLFTLSLLTILAFVYLFYSVNSTLKSHKTILEIQEDFFNNMTHEFKTPISSIRLASKVLRQSITEEKKVKMLDLIEKESHTLETQINGVLDLSFNNYSTYQINVESCKIDDIINQAINRVLPQLQQNGAKIKTQSNTKNQIVKVDQNHLINCISNLIVNSIKYVPQNLKIQINSYLKGKNIEIHIQDNGPGIPQEYHEKIFDKFVRVNKNNQYNGTSFGLGLNYVKTIIEKHNGKIFISPDFNKGALFIIQLPYG